MPFVLSLFIEQPNTCLAKETFSVKVLHLLMMKESSNVELSWLFFFIHVILLTYPVCFSSVVARGQKRTHAMSEVSYVQPPSKRGEMW